MARLVERNENNQTVWEVAAVAFKRAGEVPPPFAEPIGIPPHAYHVKAGARISSVVQELDSDVADLVLAKAAGDAARNPPARAARPVDMVWSENVAKVLGIRPESVAERLRATGTRTEAARRIVHEAAPSLDRLRKETSGSVD